MDGYMDGESNGWISQIQQSPQVSPSEGLWLRLRMQVVVVIGTDRRTDMHKTASIPL